MGLVDKPSTFRGGPDSGGHYGDYGGRFVAETLMPLILELEHEYEKAKTRFSKNLGADGKQVVGREGQYLSPEEVSPA